MVDAIDRSSRSGHLPGVDRGAGSCPTGARPGVALRPVASEPDFRYSDLLPTGKDDTPYRLVTDEGVSTFEAGGRTITYEGLRQRKGTSNGIDSEIFAELSVTQGGREVALLEPARRLFTNFPGQPTTVVGLQSTLRDDLYVFLQGWDDTEAIELHVFVNPLVNWLWIGSAIYILGGVLAWVPRPASEPARAAVPAGGAAGSKA